MSASWRKWEWGGVYDLSGCEVLGTELRTVEGDACEISIIGSSAMMHKRRRLISFVSDENLLDMKIAKSWAATFCRAAGAAFSDLSLRNEAGMKY